MQNTGLESVANLLLTAFNLYEFYEIYIYSKMSLMLYSLWFCLNLKNF